MYSFTTISPLGPISMPLSFKNAVSGRTPMLRSTMSAGIFCPSLRMTPSLSMAVQVWPRQSPSPLARM